MEKGRSSESSTQNQPSPGVSKETIADKYSTCREDIAELAIADIQPCPIIPDFKEPTASTLPIIAQTPEASFCVDGLDLIEQARAAGRATIRCHIYHIAHHSIIELAIRKAAIRVMPQGGKCTYAESVRNTQRLYRILQGTSDDLVLFTHGGARRGVGFTDSRENNIREVLANRLGKSQTTINKYLQHGDGLNDAAMEALVNSGAKKSLFEAFQAQKPTIMAVQQSEQKDPSAIAETISNEVMQWLAESRELESPPATAQTREQPPQTERSGPGERPASSGSPGPASTPRIPENVTGDSPPSVSAPVPTGGANLPAELKSIGEALINIAEDQEVPIPEQIDVIRALVIELSTLLSRIASSTSPEVGEAGGTA